MDTLELLKTRRSVKAAEMIAPGPDSKALADILEAAHRVPDHGKIGPWRFIVFDGDARATFGEKLANIYQAKNTDSTEKLIDHQRNMLTRAPVVVCVVFSPDVNHPKVPLWEQQLAVGAVCQNLLVATHALGFVGQWLTEWYSFDSGVDTLLDLKDNECVAGFMYLGSSQQKPDERPRPPLSERITHWKAS